MKFTKQVLVKLKKDQYESLKEEADSKWLPLGAMLRLKAFKNEK